MERRPLGVWSPGDSRRYELRVSFPIHGVPASPSADDNAYQGAQTSVTFVWGASQP